MPDSALATLQRRFKADVLDGTSLSISEIKSTRLYSQFRRLEVYQSTALNSIYSGVAEDFPSLKHYVGEKRFDSLIEQFLKKYPPTFTNGSDTGVYLSRFLLEMGESLLAEVARFDWAQVISGA